MAASPGDMSFLSVATQLYGKARIVASVPPRAFRPAPKVTSALVRIDVYPQPALDIDDVEEFFRVAKAGFISPRKQIRNCLQQGLSMPREQVTAMLEAADIDPKRRPETLSIPEWGRLYEAFRSETAAHS